MTTPETLFATTRLTLGLSRRCALSSSSVSKSLSTTAADNILDRRKRKRDDSDQISYLPAFEGWFMVDAILTPGSAPLPRTLTSDPPLLGHRYLPVAIAGDGAFSQTILARDVLHPREPIVAIKAIKPGFEAIGKQVISHLSFVADGRNIIYCDGYRILKCRNIRVFPSSMQMLRSRLLRRIILFLRHWNQVNYLCLTVLIDLIVTRMLVVL